MSGGVRVLAVVTQPSPWRCANCRRVLALVELRAGVLIVVCRHCKHENRLEKRAA